MWATVCMQRGLMLCQIARGDGQPLKHFAVEGEESYISQAAEQGPEREQWLVRAIAWKLTRGWPHEHVHGFPPTQRSRPAWNVTYPLAKLSSASTAFSFVVLIFFKPFFRDQGSHPHSQGPSNTPSNTHTTGSNTG